MNKIFKNPQTISEKIHTFVYTDVKPCVLQKKIYEQS